ncbi:SgcJ/EcaC family oxidoreductase [Gemmobacter fulvus]|uniref:SgcJ/EcaC family oxidoreductase n=1 Tax=Gemmobacter fulvus TaxID=2840474 RepID=A0A975S1A0_9RHOB|nr:SgcJ/EcaC family oxidoreductase [Gemmobacter fulvus]MBT9247073.1 SgcJ/EcaC family oxidoreductase [Gemmobacter fulvus]MDQ1847493.1 SgcJ/EcaC family oxidoreductase [Gemmobacter fulvus]QWK89840.1 SgcJ/EcaC family oxidoreductase [Gemmobacter fulvus]
MTPDDFTRSFVTLWSARDAKGLAQLACEDADMLTLTGLWCEGRTAITAAFEAELTGLFSRARLVTGKGKLRPLGPGAAVLHQRFVLSGLVDAEGRDLGRIGALLIATLVAKPEGWQAVTLQFSATDG